MSGALASFVSYASAARAPRRRGPDGLSPVAVRMLYLSARLWFARRRLDQQPGSVARYDAACRNCAALVIGKGC